MKRLGVFDVVIVGMFVFGLAFSLTHLNTNQETSIADNIIEVPPQQGYLIDPVS